MTGNSDFFRVLADAMYKMLSFTTSEVNYSIKVKNSDVPASVKSNRLTDMAVLWLSTPDTDVFDIASLISAYFQVCINDFLYFICCYFLLI